MESNVYSISEIQDILGIGRTRAYEYVKKVYEDKAPFRVIKVGNNYRIIKSSFDNWLDGSMEDIS